MSIIFGILKQEGSRLAEPELRSLGAPTERFTTNKAVTAIVENIGMGFQLNNTHLRSTLETQPAHDDQGNLLTLDGRLDNFERLCGDLGLDAEGTADSQIALAAFARWGEDCFSRLVGDWAVALWSESGSRLYLARDHAGTRSLYYKKSRDGVMWSTYLDAFGLSSSAHELDARYASRYMALQPIGDLTPYRDVTSVTPAHFLVFHKGRVTKKPHWDWIAREQIVYRRDADYEAHFNELFSRSVQRRTGPGAPVIAHLSGGMDSSSIVCMSDAIRRSEGAEKNGLLDTISFFDDTEPTWDDGSYFPIVEAFRGKVGIHIDVSTQRRDYAPIARSEGFYCLPGGDASTAASEHRLSKVLYGRGYRAILSGVGGDELLGGVPTVLPQLADHFVSGAWDTMSRLAMDSCLAERTPMVSLPIKLMGYFWKIYGPQARLRVKDAPPWLTRDAIRHSQSMGNGLPNRGSTLALPSVIDSGTSWWSIVATLPHLTPELNTRYEYRYPFLDRDLVDFLLRVPKQQLVRPNRRRSLMRRAMRAVLPEPVLERRRKAHLSRSPTLSLVAQMSRLESAFRASRLAQLGLIDDGAIVRQLHLIETKSGMKWVAALTRTAVIEVWLQSLLESAT